MDFSLLGFSRILFSTLLSRNDESVQATSYSELMRKRKRSYGRRRKSRKPRYNRRRYTRRRSYKARRRSFKTRQLGLFPTHQFKRFRFRIRANFSITALLPNTYFVIRGNGPYDPEYGSGGASPFDWSAASSFYSNYLCFGSKFYVKVHASSTANQYRLYVKPSITPTVTSFTAIDDERWTTVRTLGTVYSSNSNTTVKRYASSKRILERSPQTDESQISITSGLPIKEWYWICALEMMNNQAGVASDSLGVDLCVDYYVKLYNTTQDILN